MIEYGNISYRGFKDRLKADHPGIGRIVLFIKDKAYSDDDIYRAEALEIWEALKNTGIEELFIDTGIGFLLAIGLEYGDISAVIECGHDENILSISRAVRLLLCACLDSNVSCDKNYIPYSIVNKNLKKWCARAGLIFGKPFGSMLASEAMKNRNLNMITMEELESIRAFIVSYTGGCIKMDYIEDIR
jgi:hypothetical protein